MKTFSILKRDIIAILLTLVMVLTLTACGSNDADGAMTKEGARRTTAKSENTDSADPDTPDTTTDTSTDSPSKGSDTSTGVDTSSIFSKRDLEQSPDLSDAKSLTLHDNDTINITEEGTYLLKGTAADCTIRVELEDPDGKVQLVLDGVTITNRDFPAIYVVAADKCFITTTDSVNTLAVTAAFRADGDTNTDAVIYSKDDLTLNGAGTLTIQSAKGNGIACKDDLKVTAGTYNLSTALDSLEANDSIAINGGTFVITTQKDALHSENENDNSVGYIYIAGGDFTIQAKSDGIQGTSYIRIDGGTYKIKASEGIEGTYIEINDGDLDIYGSDDGINASRKSGAYNTPTIIVNGGHLKIETGSGDTDALDANGNIFVNGGTIEVTQNGMSSFDYDGKAEFNGGTIYINGQQVDSIPKDMFGPGGGRGGNGGNGGGRGGNGGDSNGKFYRPDFQMPDGGDFQLPDDWNGSFQFPDEWKSELPDGFDIDLFTPSSEI